MFVLSEVSAGRPFSAAVRRSRGARLRRARSARRPVGPRCRPQGADPGAHAGLSRRARRGPTISCRSAYAALSLTAFLERLPELDAAWQHASRRSAGREGPRAALRRVGDATQGVGRAGRRARVEPDGTASGTRNLVTFHSRRYQREPLVISGPGRRRGRHGGRHPQRHPLAGDRDDAGRDAAADPDQPRLRRRARSTPLEDARRLSQRTGNHVFLKREDLQPIFTYKLRGAYNRMAHLTRRRARARRDRGQRRQSCAGRGLLGAAPWRERADRDAADDAGDQGRRGARAWRRGRAGRRHATPMPRHAPRRSRPRADASRFMPSTIRW